MSWRKITFIVVALIILLGGSAALSQLFVSMKPEPPRRPEMEVKRLVKAEIIKYEEITSSVSREGRVASSNDVTLVSEASGKIQQGAVSLRKGAAFKKGQLLAEIYKDEVELALQARKSRFLTTITTMLPDIKIDYPDHFEKFMSFFNSIDIAKELPALPEFNDEKLKIFLASRNVLSEYYGILQDQKRLSRHSLYAPFNGTFTQVNFEVGGYVNTGGQIAKMIRTDELEIEVQVENEQSKWIKIGDKVMVYSKSLAKRPGKVIRKAAYIDPTSQSRSVFVKVTSSASDELLAGEYKMVEFPLKIKVFSFVLIILIVRFLRRPSTIVNTSFELKTALRGISIAASIFCPGNSTILYSPAKSSSEAELINVKENSPVGIVGEEQPKRGPQKGQKPQGGKGKANNKQKA